MWKKFHQILHQSLSILIWMHWNPRYLVFICDAYGCKLELGISFMTKCIKFIRNGSLKYSAFCLRIYGKGECAGDRATPISISHTTSIYSIRTISFHFEDRLLKDCYLNCIIYANRHLFFIYLETGEKNANINPSV